MNQGLLFSFLAIMLIIIEISTIILQSTGLDRKVARFQAISLLTGTGYTTSEAELMTKHPLRRRVAELLIIFGHLSFAVILALILGLLNKEFLSLHLLEGVAVLIVVLLLLRSKRLQSWLLKRMKLSLSRVATLEEVFHLSEKEDVVEVTLTEQHAHLFSSLRELNLASKHGIHILTIARQEEKGEYDKKELIKYPTGKTRLQQGDKLILFGEMDKIEAVFKKKRLS